MRRSDELRIIQTNLDQIQFAINRSRADLEQAQKTLNYVMEKLQKIINSYKKNKKPIT